MSASRRKPSSTPALPTKMSSRPKAATRRRHRPLVVVKPGDIAGDRGHLVAEFGAQLVAAAGDPIHDRDPRPLLDKARDDRPANARAAAGHQRYLAIEPAHGDNLSVGARRLPYQRVRLYS